MERPVKIACHNLWKIFGPKPTEFLARHDRAPSAADLTAGGYIAAVHDVSFEVFTGEILIIMGLSGSGKSTLVRCLSRLIEPTEGQILFEGQDLLQASETDLIELRRHKMGMVFQHFGLLPHRTVLDNVAFPLEVQGISRPRREERAREMVRLVGLDGREEYYPRELSGGQQQRVGIARSLAVEPEVWFLDEPFSALDPLIRREMQDEFLRLQRLLKKTIVFITHDFAEATRLADRIGIMKDGALIQLCSPEEMITRPADAYVAEFTKDAPRAKLISARTAMTPAGGLVSAEGGVPASAKVEEIAAYVLGRAEPVPVLGDAGEPIGVLGRDAVVEIVFGGPRSLESEKGRGERPTL
ncbi:ATP-binding cassette domain-containing protein [Rhodospirillaceae bacterium SYSU D60014]|uniref:quaternary amine ABC transporter ATP-binding protein n=1 Tax=Virgifigura deserti TaxID=2268457 RepID=UPI000E6710BB